MCQLGTRGASSLENLCLWIDFRGVNFRRTKKARRGQSWRGGRFTPGASFLRPLMKTAGGECRFAWRAQRGNLDTTRTCRAGHARSVVIESIASRSAQIVPLVHAKERVHGWQIESLHWRKVADHAASPQKSSGRASPRSAAIRAMVGRTFQGIPRARQLDTALGVTPTFSASTRLPPRLSMSCSMNTLVTDCGCLCNP